MNLAMKKMPWMVASLLAATSVFGQGQGQTQGGCPTQPPVCKPTPRCGPLQAPQQPTNCAYNAPAEINTGMQGDINFFAAGSFLYWQPSQDNMSVGLTSNNQVLVSTAPEVSINGSFIDMNFKFKPGFKVGLGMNLQTDDWDGYAEYTRVHGQHSTSSNGVRALPSIFATWGHPFLLAPTNGAGNIFESVASTYNNRLDFVDAEMGRMYYVGKSLLFRPAWGARAAWILQNMSVHYANVGITSAISDATGSISALPSALSVYQRTHSWAVGPRAGLNMDWVLGCGFRFFGSGYGDILYTKYNVKDKTVLLPRVNTGAFRIGNPVSVITHDKVGLVRAHLDFETGFGWGSYFDNNNWHIDLSASYGWQVFFAQNMFRQFQDDQVVGNNTMPHGDLYVQGLTATIRLDF